MKSIYRYDLDLICINCRSRDTQTYERPSNLNHKFSWLPCKKCRSNNWICIPDMVRLLNKFEYIEELFVFNHKERAQIRDDIKKIENICNKLQEIFFEKEILSQEELQELSS